MRGKRHAGIRARAALALAMCLASGPAASGGETSEPVTLEIRNESATPLRCVLLLAHFFTIEAGSVAAGQTLGLTLDLDPASGALSILNEGGKPMMVEQILCGAAADWSRTRSDISLVPLRAASGAYRTSCTAGSRTLCATPAVAK